MGNTLYFYFRTCLTERFLSTLLHTNKKLLASKEIHGYKKLFSTYLGNIVYHYSVNEENTKEHC